MHLHPALAPVKACICPLSKKLSEGALKVFEDLREEFHVEYDEAGSIGKRYRRNDAIGTPFCITYDFETDDPESPNYQSVTIRHRDSMEQERVKIADLPAYFEGKFDF
jgi:glycyl-tRNA synthetase